MSNETLPSKSVLLANMQAGWDKLQAYIQSLTEAQLTGPTDAAGWTGKDHLIHLAVWEGGVVALLNRQSRREYMGIDEATWANDDFDATNAIIQQRHKDMPLADVLNTLRDTHRRMVETVESLSEADLRQPYSAYDPTTDSDSPVINRIIGNTYAHYAEHIPWIDAIVRQG
ncbi:MAG TPA: ClbS/DfsB family four-helix bundle protein [Spirillospora sp.]|nr:ClbS/DfsB family four-helix bundle protein [Spirillospora sp.]